ncbi:MAG: hypothetical protein FIB03_14435 [Anaerolineae bacterium]|nr:hypothetical protein [Anaerolineae bacterium]
MMEFNWSIVGWIAGLLFVYIFGLFEGRNQGRKRRIAEEQEEKKQQPAPQPAAVKVDDPGLLRIKNESGGLTLDLDGARVDTSALTSDQRKRLIEILNAIRPWLEGKSKPVPAPSTPAAPSIESRLGALDAPPQGKPVSVTSPRRNLLRQNKPHRFPNRFPRLSQDRRPGRMKSPPRPPASSGRSMRSCKPASRAPNSKAWASHSWSRRRAA